jgi:hypothetical protein
MDGDAMVERLSPGDAARMWSRSGAQWLTATGVAVPYGVVDRVHALVRSLDARGAGLSGLVGTDGMGILAERAAVTGVGPSSEVSCGGATRLMRAADRWVAMTVARPSDVDLLPALFESASASVTLDDGQVDWAAIGEHVGGSSSALLVERAALLGVACSIVGEETDGQPAKPERVGDADPARLSDLVVANLGALWAAPLAADVLARLGARVLTIESIRRPDGARSTDRFFAALHGRTESVALELDRSVGQEELRRLLARVDVVIEASRPRALRHMGIDGRTLARTGPRVWIALTAHGQDQPDRVGFGDDAAAAGGVVGWRDGSPVFLADAIADPVTGLTIAERVGALVDAGGRWHVDVALSRVARSCAGGPHLPPAPRAAPPVPRSDAGAPLELGRDTERVLREFGVR